MNRVVKLAMVVGGVALCAAAASAAGAALGDDPTGGTPSSFKYDMKNGKRAPKEDVLSSTPTAGGGRRDQVKVGDCTVTRDYDSSGRLVASVKSC